LLKDIDDVELQFCSEFHTMDVLSFNRAFEAVLNRLNQIPNAGVFDTFVQGWPSAIRSWEFHNRLAG